jgi:hypothetical protein
LTTRGEPRTDSFRAGGGMPVCRGQITPESIPRPLFPTCPSAFGRNRAPTPGNPRIFDAVLPRGPRTCLLDGELGVEVLAPVLAGRSANPEVGADIGELARDEPRSGLLTEPGRGVLSQVTLPSNSKRPGNVGGSPEFRYSRSEQIPVPESRCRKRHDSTPALLFGGEANFS